MAKHSIFFGKIVKIRLTIEGKYFCLQPQAFDVEFLLRT